MKTQQIIIAFSTWMFLTANISAQSGGTFAITQSVIATGGQQSSSGIFSLEGTAGQAVAGENSANGIFGVRGGFWLPGFVPTASMVSVGGRVRTAQGSGIRNVIVSLTDASGAIRTAQTGSFGYFRFDGVAVGETYLISVAAKRFAFAQPTIIRSVQEEIADLDFIADDL
jgi:hypothetical protein